MPWWIWTLNVTVLLLMIVLFYRRKRRWVSKSVLLAPIFIYVLISVEDLLNWIDWNSIVPGENGMRALILLFCLASVLFYTFFIFNEIKVSNHKEIMLKHTLTRISIATVSCIVFFTIVYTSIYKLFGQTSFRGEGIGEGLLSQLITFLYFSMATFSTVGYGDIAPIDNTSRLVVMMQISFSFITVAYALSMLSVFRKILGPATEEEVDAEMEIDVKIKHNHDKDVDTDPVNK